MERENVSALIQLVNPTRLRSRPERMSFRPADCGTKPELTYGHRAHT
jgi:hypothetical protein